jgi:hypothetical protein
MSEAVNLPLISLGLSQSTGNPVLRQPGSNGMSQGNTAEVGTTVPPAMSYIKQVGQMGYLATRLPPHRNQQIMPGLSLAETHNETHSLSERATTVYRIAPSLF